MSVDIGAQFQRHSPDRANSLLNYGYAIIRSLIARHVVAAGYVPQLGLHHRRQTNPFNLADDLIEPYRPFVDSHVLQRMGEEPAGEELTPEDKRFMAELPMREFAQLAETISMLTAVERTVASLKEAFRLRDPAVLVLPDLPMN